MSELLSLNEKLARGESLSPKEAESAAVLLTEVSIDPNDKQTFLEKLHLKGETVEEVSAFARVFRRLSLDPGFGKISEKAIDIVGTGGTGSGGYNFSSVTAFVMAASGIPVLKHGNRAITSKSGSADFLSIYGIPLTADLEGLKQSVEELNFCFFFAPAFHPAFKEIMPVRKKMAAAGKRSVFNILGPLINPAKPAYQLLGVYSDEWVQPLSQVLSDIGVKSGMVVNCQLSDGSKMDEFTPSGMNQIQGFGEQSAIGGTLTGKEIGLPDADPNELRGGTAEENSALLDQIMNGKGPDGLLNGVIFNAAAGFMIVGDCSSWKEGIEKARDVILGGRLKNWTLSVKDYFKV